MRFSAALVAGFAAATSAFLLPPEIPADVPEDAPFQDTQYKDFPDTPYSSVHPAIVGNSEIIHVECPDCPFASEPSAATLGGENWVKNAETSIRLTFSGGIHGFFRINGKTVLPFEQAQAEAFTVMEATQVQMDTGAESEELPISFVIEEFQNLLQYENDLVLVAVNFTVLEIANTPVHVDTVRCELIKDMKQSPTAYYFVKTSRIPYNQTPGAVTCEGSSRWSLCRVKAIVTSHLKAMMEAAKARAHKINGWVAEKSKGKKFGGCRKGGPWRHGQPHGEKSHHGHHHHRHHHRLGHVLHQILRFAIIPVLLGVIGGLTASALGMLVGQAIVYLWHRGYRRGQHGPLRIVQQEVVLVEDEKDGLLVEEILEEEPPRYQDDIEVAPQESEK